MMRALSKTVPAILALLAVCAITLFCYRLLHANATVAAVALLLCVLITGTYAKLAEALLASFAATLCLDYFFIPPVGSVTVADPQGWIVLLVFLVVSLIATNLSSRLLRQRDRLVEQQTEAERLHALSRSMLLSDGAEDIGRLVVNKCMELFPFSEVVVFEILTGAFYRSQSESSIEDAALRNAARRGEIQQNKMDHVTMLPVALGNKVFGSVAFRGAPLNQQALQTLGSTIAMGLAQAQARDAGGRAEAVRKSEELKSVMIDALAHDLKTPLTAIEAASGMLLTPANLSDAQRQDLLEVIQEEAAGVRRIVEEAIHLARIDAKKLKLECQPAAVDELIQSAIRWLGERGSSQQAQPHPVETSTNGALFVSADRDLIVQALKQMLDNAAKYSPSKSTISVSAAEVDGTVTISVRDHGQGLTELEQGRVFDKFYRGQQHRSSAPGTGMGLAIVKEIVEAHGGSAGVRSQLGQGSEFYICLPVAQQEPVAGPQQL